MSFANAKNALSLLLLAATLGSLSACGDPEDHYSTVFDKCNYLVPNLGDYLLTKEERIASTLKPECRDVLTQKRYDADKNELPPILPFDDTWDKAPPGFKDKVIEAFQALIAYPIKVTDRSTDTLLGTRPKYKSPIPDDVYEIFTRYENPNQAIFNFVVNRIQNITFDPNASTEHIAQWVPGVSLDLKWKRMTIYGNFWDADDSNAYYVNPFQYAITLVHEARHLDGPHQPCNGDYGEIQCDNELIGPYGTEIIYMHYLLAGSGSCEGEGCEPLLPGLIFSLTASGMVDLLQHRINRESVYPELRKVLDDLDAGKIFLSGSWLQKADKIDRGYGPGIAEP
jgi:hypothetical protein